MKYIALTSPEYRFLDDGFLYLWNKYINFPCFLFETAQNAWAKSFHKYLQTLNDEPIMLVLTDYFIIDYPDINRLLQAKQLIDDKFVDKVDLTDQVKYWGSQDAYIGYLNCFMANPSSQYRQSTQAAIWDYNMILDYFSHYDSPWNWETGKWSMHDRYNIIGFDKKVIEYANVYLKGSPDQFQINKIKTEDREYLKSIGCNFDKIMPVRWKG